MDCHSCWIIISAFKKHHICYFSGTHVDWNSSHFSQKFFMQYISDFVSHLWLTSRNIHECNSKESDVIHSDDVVRVRHHWMVILKKKNHPMFSYLSQLYPAYPIDTGICAVIYNIVQYTSCYSIQCPSFVVGNIIGALKVGVQKLRVSRACNSLSWKQWAIGSWTHANIYPWE